MRRRKARRWDHPPHTISLTDRLLVFLPPNRTEWTPQVTVLDRDKMPHPQSIEREREKEEKKGGGEAV